MMIQEGKVEIVEEEKPKALQQVQPKEMQNQKINFVCKNKQFLK